MTPHIPKVVVGAALYLGLALSLYGLSIAAFPNSGGPIPLWFASAQVLLEATASVVPGFLVGWLARDRGFLLGAITGALGAIVGNIAQLNLWVVPPLAEFSLSLGVGAVSVVLAASITNAVGGMAGAALRNQLMPSNPPLNRTRANNARAG